VLLLGAENPRSNQPAVYRSADGGINWTPVYTPNTLYRYHSGRALAFDPTAPVRAYAVTASETPAQETINTIARSQDAGLTWTPVMTSTGVHPGLATLAVARDGTVYVGGEEGGYGSRSAIVVRSTDHGVHWTQIYAAAGATVLGLATDPTDASTVYLIDSTNRLRRSSDAGDNWTTVYTSPAPLRALAHDPALSGRLYLGADGPAVLTSPDEGGSWSELAGWGGGVVSPQLSSLAVDGGWPTQTLYAGLNGVWRRSQHTPGGRIFLPVVLRQ
jgi:hypothetical protein